MIHQPKTYLILGYGYTAQYLAPQILMENIRKVYGTRRSFSQENKSPIDWLSWDLSEKSTWNSLKSLTDVDIVFWLLPLGDFTTLKSFWDFSPLAGSRHIVLTTTSHYKVEQDDQLVTEETPWDLSKERVKCDAFLKDQGTVVLCSSGIYGPNRNPLRWLREGRIGSPERHVNFIHVEDLAQALIKAVAFGKPGEVYNLSDGQEKTWLEIATWAIEEELLKDVTWAEPKNKVSKIIDNTKMLSELDVELMYDDFFEAVRGIDVQAP